jgi:hypothetical protein
MIERLLGKRHGTIGSHRAGFSAIPSPACGGGLGRGLFGPPIAVAIFPAVRSFFSSDRKLCVRGRAPSPTLPRKRGRGCPHAEKGACIALRSTDRMATAARILLRAILATIVFAVARPAAAEETVKVALGQRGDWETAASELGQDAGLFRKRGLALDLRYTTGSSRRCRR